jgi:hypothetical protein
MLGVVSPEGTLSAKGRALDKRNAAPVSQPEYMKKSSSNTGWKIRFQPLPNLRLEPTRLSAEMIGSAILMSAAGFMPISKMPVFRMIPCLILDRQQRLRVDFWHCFRRRICHLIHMLWNCSS